MAVTTTTTDETRALGAQLAAEAAPGQVYALIGALGTGKTELVRGFVLHLEPQAPVRSPTFTLVNVYDTPSFPVYHFDFYRLSDASEFTEIGLAEYLSGDGVCLVEWADMFLEELPQESLRVIRLTDVGNGRREIDISPVQGRECGESATNDEPLR